MRSLNTVFLLTLILQGGVVSPRGSSLVLSLSMASSLAQVSDLAAEEKPMIRLCGWRLANKLNQVCKGIYNKPSVTNNDLFYRSMRGESFSPVFSSGRRVPLEISNDNFKYLLPTAEDYNYYLEGRGNDGISPEGYVSKEKERFPFLSRKEASQMFLSHPRSKRGLSAECCRKACRISELMGYCQ
ncbi:LIRP-like [Palaemon carinicauda]|uniref:LIRP-like n=1 Tax=Palaemon carinicauda TaxID=392227 RepID=UPI0035B686B2